jgi:hypothetical protein
MIDKYFHELVDALPDGTEKGIPDFYAILKAETENLLFWMYPKKKKNE